jgi:hypothetical protein
MRSGKTRLSRLLGKALLQHDRGEVSHRSEARSRDEAGATLVLALLFLVVIGLIVGGLASWTANNLTDAVVFQNARSAEFALNGATQAATQNIRYAPLINPGETLNASPPSYCWGTSGDPTYGGSELTTQGDPVYVYCSTAWNPASSVTRQVTISACLQSELTVPSQAAATCAANPGLQTIVNFDDYQSNLNTTNPAPCQSTCGTGMTIVSSSAGATTPSVTALSPSSGLVTGGTALTITGSGFANGSTTVYFVDPLAPNDITTIQPSNVTFNSATSLSVTTPGVTTVANYYVVVSTPEGGNSLEGPQYAYQPVVPTVTSIAPNSGAANGGTEVTINGTGFLSNNNGDLTRVTFTDTANTTITATAPSLAVNSSGTVITATAPSITTGTTYYVTVTTKPGGTSIQSASLEFTFDPYYPVAAAISPTSGGSGTSVAITGLGFLSGGTIVTLIPTNGAGGNLNLTNVAVSSSTSLTAQVPNGGTNGAMYYVSITTTWNGTQYQSCNANGNGGIPTCSSEGAPTYQY